MVKEKAYAKINLFLNVVAKRFDGYHDLEMVMAPLELHDVLEFKELDINTISIVSQTKMTKNVEDNIVYKVAEFIKNEFNIAKGVEIHIQKNIPIAGGLAGGSADAAATFRGLNKLWKLNLTLDEMAKLALEFGSDIPFCIYNKLCIAKGRGEDLMFLDKKLKLPVLIVNPRIPVSTKDVFGNVTENTIKERKITDMTNAIFNRNYELIIRELHNSLEEITFDMYGDIRKLKNHIIDTGVPGTLMSGSGSTVFAISKDVKKLKYTISTIRDDYFKVLTKIR